MVCCLVVCEGLGWVDFVGCVAWLYIGKIAWLILVVVLGLVGVSFMVV